MTRIFLQLAPNISPVLKKYVRLLGMNSFFHIEFMNLIYCYYCYYFVITLHEKYVRLLRMNIFFHIKLFF